MVNATLSDKAKRDQQDKKAEEGEIVERSPKLINDVQYYLVAKYREALKSGDKSFANSCLLAAKLFSANNPNMTDEDQILAKSDGDVSEAAKYFNSIFEQLFGKDELTISDDLSSEVLGVANQMKEEIRLLLTELKTQTLKLKSTPDPWNPSNMRQAPPSSSPRSRMSSEDRSLMSRDSISKLDSHLISHKRSCFYQELFDNLPQETRRNLIDYSIQNCDNPFERCRLMMLGMTLTNDCVKNYAPKLLQTLMELSEPTIVSGDKSAAAATTSNTADSNKSQRSIRVSSMWQYARSMLVLDAIPLIFGLTESQELEVNIEVLINLTFKYYAEFCLASAASEFQLEELHESVYKSLIALDPLKSGSLEDHIEDRVNLSLNLMFDKFLQELPAESQVIKTKKLEKLRQLAAADSPGSFEPLLELLSELEINVELPESVLFSPTLREDEISARTAPVTVTPPPPKGRGRPKKTQVSVIVSSDEELRRNQTGVARRTVFAFGCCMQLFFRLSAQYLKWTRCMVAIEQPAGANPLARAVSTELAKGQRRSARQANADAAQPAAKRHKAAGMDEIDEGVALELDQEPCEELAGSLQGARLREALKKLATEARSFMAKSSGWFELIGDRQADSLGAQNIGKLWAHFSSASVAEMPWFRRILVDQLLHTGQPAEAERLLELHNQGELTIKREEVANDERVLTVPVGPSGGLGGTVDVSTLRATAQLVQARVQLSDGPGTLATIAELLAKIKQTGLAVSPTSADELTNVAVSPARHKYELLLAESTLPVDFPLLTVSSLVSYCVHLLMELLQCYVTQASSASSSDAAIGHAIVLSQANWTRYSVVYYRAIEWIRATKPKSTTPQSISAATKFTYPDFFYFVQDPTILEDFMALLNDGHTLDIKSATHTSSGAGGVTSRSTSSARGSNSSGSGKAITTRGVNKSFKEDLRLALAAQMRHSCAPVPLELIVEFIQSPLIPFLLAEAPLPRLPSQ